MGENQNSAGQPSENTPKIAIDTLLKGMLKDEKMPADNNPTPPAGLEDLSKTPLDNLKTMLSEIDAVGGPSGRPPTAKTDTSIRPVKVITVRPLSLTEPETDPKETRKEINAPPTSAEFIPVSSVEAVLKTVSQKSSEVFSKQDVAAMLQALLRENQKMPLSGNTGAIAAKFAAPSEAVTKLEELIKSHKPEKTTGSPQTP